MCILWWEFQTHQILWYDFFKLNERTKVQFVIFRFRTARWWTRSLSSDSWTARAATAAGSSTPSPRPPAATLSAVSWSFFESDRTEEELEFFYSIPCTYTSSPLDGMARNYIIIRLLFVYLNGYARSHILLCLDPFCSYLLMPEERKNIKSVLELNPGPLPS